MPIGALRRGQELQQRRDLRPAADGRLQHRAGPSSVGAPLSVNPDPRNFCRQFWYEPKKNVLVLEDGAAESEADLVLVERRRLRCARRSCRDCVRALRLLSLWNQNADPRNWLVPLLVMTFITDPAARPYSAENWFVMSRTSCTMSVLLIGCWRPVTLGSLLSWPSSMKLLERRRAPLTAKFDAVGEAGLPRSQLADAGSRQGQVEDVAAVAQRQLGDAPAVETNADLGVGRVEQRGVGPYGHGLGDGRRPERHLRHRILVQQQADAFLGVPAEAGQVHDQRVVADREVREPERAVGSADDAAGEVGVDVTDGDRRAGDDGALFVANRTLNRARGGLRVGFRGDYVAITSACAVRSETE